MKNRIIGFVTGLISLFSVICSCSDSSTVSNKHTVVDNLHFVSYDYYGKFFYFVIILWIVGFICCLIINFKNKEKDTSDNPFILAFCGACLVSFLIDIPVWFLWIKRYSYDMKETKVEIRQGELYMEEHGLMGRLLDSDGNCVDIDDQYYIENTTDSALMLVPYIYTEKFMMHNPGIELPETVYIKPHTTVVFDTIVQFQHSAPNEWSYYMKHATSTDSIRVEWCLESNTKENLKLRK